MQCDMRRLNGCMLNLSVKLIGFRLSVADDGIGFDSEDPKKPHGMGLRILRHRSELIGGSLSIESDKTGTTVLCEVLLHGKKDCS